MDEIRQKVKELPDTFGVYLIKDVSGRIVYVGKANSIRKRLYSHLGTKLGEKIAGIDFIVTTSELSALILEAKLIKQYRPKYNVMMRDDKAYPYIKITKNEDFPQVITVRKIEDDGAEYFGPFRGGSAREIIKLVGRLFPVRRCRTSPLKKRKLPCLNFHMNKCLSPCTGKIGNKEYRKIIMSVEKFFEKGLDETVSELRQKMEEASRRNEFEEAAGLRDKIKWIEMACGKSKPFSSKGIKRASSLEELSRLTGMSKLPKRIEAFDISNLGPSQTVGAMVTFVNGLPKKQYYRKFIISSGTGQNDTASISEAVFRRYARSLSRRLPDPDLILIDGGKGQLSSAYEALRQAGKSIPAIGLAKKKEEIYLHNVKEAVKLPENSPALLLLRQMRDEAHRFAVSFHRKRRGDSWRDLNDHL